MSDAGSRAQKTADKTALGGLPAPFDGAPSIDIGVGAACGGCGETIASTEKLYTVNLFGALSFDFHAECYESWHTFKPRTARARRLKPELA